MKIKIRQHDAMDCGAAALASVCAYYKLHIPIARVRQYANTDRKGTNLLGLVEASTKLGFIAKGVKTTIDKDLTNIHLPAIAHILSQGKFPHYVVIYKLYKDAVQVMDPESGSLKKIPLDEFKSEWTGYLILISPDDTFKPGKIGFSKREKLFSLLKPNKRSLIQIIIGALLYTVIGISMSIYIEKITDYVLPNYNGNLMNALSVAMLLLVTIQMVIGIFRSVLNVKVGQILDIKLILGYYKQITELEQTFFDNMRVGEIISRVNDAVKIRSFINEVAVSFIVNVFIVIFSFILMYSYNWKIALIITICIPFYFILYLISNSLNKKTVRTVMEKSADLESQLVESITAMETIKLFNLEEYSNVKTEERFIALLKSLYKISINNIGIFFSGDLFGKIFTIILFWVGTYKIFQNELTPGELFSFYSLLGYFTGPIESIVTANRPYQEAVIAADRLFEIMDLQVNTGDDGDKIKIAPKMIGDIRFENVVFRYGSRAKVFDGISFTIKQNQINAFVGVSGSGKSTIVGLLEKMYPLSSGKIFIGDYDLQYLSTHSVRSVISIVPQTIVLFAGTVLENITIGDPSPDYERVVKICKELDILDFIESLPKGPSTYIGENGTSLSGGQRQRLGIARALYRDFDILVLDEATSSLDSFSDVIVQNVVKTLKDNGKTIIIITHRLASIINADNIIVLKQGNVIEQGRHQELVDAKNYYCELWNSHS